MYDAALELPTVKIGSENANAGIHTQYVNQTMPDQGIKTTHYGRYDSIFSHVLCKGPDCGVDWLSASR